MRIRKNVYLNFDKKSIDMENENKDKKILTEEELKEVEGGILGQILLNCKTIIDPKICSGNMLCKWTNGKCVKN